MPEPSSLSALAKPLIAIAGVVWMPLRKIHRERRAGSMPVEGSSDLLEKKMEETISRLSNDKIDSAWWSKILNFFGHIYISPEFLKQTALREWISDSTVQTYLKILARAKILDDETIDSNIIRNLSVIYELKTGEDKRLASGPIDVLVAIISAGYLSALSPQDEVLAGMIQQSNKAVKKGIGAIGDDIKKIGKTLQEIGPSFLIVKNHSDSAEKELDQILKRRTQPIDKIIQEITNLKIQVTEGSLIHADLIVKEKIKYWFTRLHAADKNFLEYARDSSSELKEIDIGYDRKIVLALILEAEGKINKALRILRSIDNSDGHSTFFIVLKRQKGIDVALEWYNGEENNKNYHFFTYLGWYNLAICLAEKGKWENAIEVLKQNHDEIDKWPDLAFLEGVIHAAMLLPEEIRPNALSMNIFFPGLATLEGPNEDYHRNYAKKCFSRAISLLKIINYKMRADVAEKWILWLQLTHPQNEIVQNTKKDIIEWMFQCWSKTSSFNH